MQAPIQEGQSLFSLKKNEILCKEGDQNNDLYMLHSGKLLVCLSKGSQVTPIAYISKGQYLGELSFFDGSPRSANVIAIEDSVLIKMQSDHLEKMIPSWLRTCANSLTKRLRKIDNIVNKKGLKRTNVDSVKPLSLEEQKKYFQLLK